MDRFAARLVGQQGVAAFDRDTRERRAVKFASALTVNETAGLFDLARLEKILSGGGDPAGQADVYSNEHLVRLADILHRSGRTPVDVAAEQLKKGCTLRFRDVERFDAGLADFARAVARTYATETQINVYLTPLDQAGFPPHFDNTDVFILQVVGSKDWMIHAAYSNRQELPGPEIAWDPGRYQPDGPAELHVLRVGDVLYVPRGVMHAARCRNEASMHLTISLTSLTMLVLLEQELRRLAKTDLAMRRRAPWSASGGAGETEALAAELRRLAGGLTERLDPRAAIEARRMQLARPEAPVTTGLGEALASPRSN